MTYNDQAALYAFNSYVWKLLESNLGWTKVGVTATNPGRPPMVPAQDEPELQATGKPYLIYGGVLQPSTDLYAVSTLHVSYVIKSPDVTTNNRIVNMLYKALDRHDDTAADINAWTSVEGWSGPSPVVSRRGIRFTNVRILMAGMGESPDQEGGFSNATMMIRCNYISNTTTGKAGSDIQTTGFTL